MTRTRFEDKFSISQYVANTALPVEKRTPTGPFDFGDPATVLLHVKRVGTSIENDCDDAFGRYLGEHDTGFAVLVTHVDYTPKAVEVFATLEDLKKQWQLD